jgi:hypothetical protein
MANDQALTAPAQLGVQAREAVEQESDASGRPGFAEQAVVEHEGADQALTPGRRFRQGRVVTEAQVAAKPVERAHCFLRRQRHTGPGRRGREKDVPGEALPAGR